VQREAATYTGGPLLILAGAGSGKTRCLTYRFAYLVRRFDLEPDRILAITFTNKAAREMRERIERLLGRAVAPRALWVSTFHSACARLLRRWADRVGLSPTFTIYDEDDQLSLMRQVVQEQGWDEGRWPPAGFLAAVGRAKDELITPDRYLAEVTDFRQERTAKAYALYQQRLRANNAVDFDDLIVETVRLLRENPDVLAELRSRFRHVLIDEYQDTNHAQYVFADFLAAEHRNLAVVGDDDQSIYRWRGADIRNVLEFEQDYPDAKVIRLEQNYRSTKTILAAANAVIANNRRRKGKTLWTDNEEGDPVVYFLAADHEEEARFVVAEIVGGHRRRGLPLRSFAVLYRTHAQSRAFEQALVGQGVPYQVIGGVRFYDRKEVKDILAYLRVIVNPADEVSLERALGAPRRSVGPVTLGRLREAAAREGLGLLGTMREVAAGRLELEGVGPKVRSELGRFVGLIDRLADQARAGSVTVAELVREVAEGSGLVEALRREGTAEALSRIENIQELAAVAADFARHTEDASLEAFLENAALLASIDVLKDGADGVVLMTVHNAKGLEFPYVFVVGLEQGLFPHARSLEEEDGLEEERRLFYVAMTRAMRRLYLTHARLRTLYGALLPAEPSVFLREVPREALFVAGPGDALSPARSSPGEGTKPATVSSSETERVFPGERVVHPEWGEGVVVGLDRLGSLPGRPGELRVRVAFPGGGVKILPVAEVRRKSG